MSSWQFQNVSQGSNHKTRYYIVYSIKPGTDHSDTSFRQQQEGGGKKYIQRWGLSRERHVNDAW